MSNPQSSTATAKRRLSALSEQLVSPIPDQGTFEDIPKLKQVAGPSNGPRATGNVVIITGTNSPLGIGRATAHQFAQNGARAIYLCDFATTHLETHKRELNSLYPAVEIHTRHFDASSPAGVQEVVNHALATYNRLDVFFANAGVPGSHRLFTEVEADEFMQTMKINTLSVFLAAKYAAPAMQHTSPAKKYPSGSIIATASVAGIRANAGSTDYSASKSAVVSIAQTIAFQLAGTGVRINALCPGVIETGMTAPMFDAARARGTAGKIGQLNPLKRGAHADEVARVALFLGSEESSYVNGQAWAVDGGLSAGHPFVPGKFA